MTDLLASPGAGGATDGPVAGLTFPVHVLIGLALFTLWSFTRLVHAFTAPLGSLFRPYVVYRARSGGLSERRARRRWERVDRTPAGQAMTAAVAGLGVVTAASVATAMLLHPKTWDLASTHLAVIAEQRRRLAVVGRGNALLGLLGLKRAHRGFCSDTDVAAGAAERAAGAAGA